MIRINQADRMIENLEFMASDNYYPIETDDNYIALCELVENSEDWIDRDYFMENYKKLRKNIMNF